MNARLEAAVGYAGRGWPVFPVAASKRPMTEHGLRDATTDPALIREWWGRWPGALAAIATGAASGVCAVDIDIAGSVNGFDSLDELDASVLASTPLAHTPRGGCHVLFRYPNRFVKTVAGRLGRGLDVRGDNGGLILPPGPGRWWDPHAGADCPLADWPAWADIEEPAAPALDRTDRPRGFLGRYGEAALDAAVKAILSAPAGAQRDTLNAEAFGVGQLVAGGVIPSALAQDALLWAARGMTSYDHRRPWRDADLQRIVMGALLDGQRHPRSPAA